MFYISGLIYVPGCFYYILCAQWFNIILCIMSVSYALYYIFCISGLKYYDTQITHPGYCPYHPHISPPKSSTSKSNILLDFSRRYFTLSTFQDWTQPLTHKSAFLSLFLMSFNDNIQSRNLEVIIDAILSFLL
jgi:hypothetical protein